MAGGGGWRQTIAAFFRSAKVMTMFGGLTGTGVYVSYTDLTRDRRMMINYAAGNILPPMADHAYETVYFPRPKLEQVNLSLYRVITVGKKIFRRRVPGCFCL